MKSKRTIRMLSIILASVMMLSVFTSCQKSEGEDNTQSKKPNEGAQDIVFSEPGTYPIANKTIPLKIFMSMSSQTDYETNTFTKYIEKKTGIDLTFETCTADAATEKLNLLLTGGDYPDAIFARPDENRYGVEDKILIDLSPYLEKLPLLDKQVEKYPNLLSDMKAVDGKTYFLPGFDNCYQCSYSGKMWVNTKHLEAMNEKVPTTTDEFYELLKKYKQYDPKGIPMCAFSGWVADPFTYLSGSFFSNIWNVYGLRLEGEKITTYASIAEYREALKYLAKLYKEGLLNEDAFTLEEAQVAGILAQPNEPVLFFPSGNTYFTYSESNPEIYGHYQPIAPLKGPNGVQNCMFAPIYPLPAFAVTNKCEYPEAAVRFAEVFYDTEEFLNSQLGMKGTFWEEPSDGGLGIDGKPAIFKMIEQAGSGAAQNDHWVYRGIYHWADLRMNEESPVNADLKDPKYTETLAYTSSRDLYAPYHPKDVKPLPSLKFTVEESAAKQTIAVEVEKLIEEQKALFVTGGLDPDSDADWNAYLASLESVGMSKLIEVYQQAYDRKMSMK